MAARRRALGIVRRVSVMLAIFCALGSPLDFDNQNWAQRATAQDSDASVRIVHALTGVGPLDIYVDGAIAIIGMVFGETSAPITVTGGDRDFAVVPTGGSLETALVNGPVSLRGGADYYTALLGSSDSVSVGLFAIDGRELDAGRARFRIISGIPDGTRIVPIFAGGDALTEPLSFGDASEYASIDAGAYDLDMLDAESGISLLAVPQTPLAEGTSTDVILVGQLADASLAALIETVVVDLAQPVGRLGQLISGTCADPGEVLADLGLVRPGEGQAVGSEANTAASQGYGLSPVSFAQLVKAPSAVIVVENEDAAGEIVACGNIGGRLTDTGSLVVAMESPGSGAPMGVAVLAPGFDDPGTTGVSVFLTGPESARADAATPVPAPG